MNSNYYSKNINNKSINNNDNDNNNVASLIILNKVFSHHA